MGEGHSQQESQAASQERAEQDTSRSAADVPGAGSDHIAPSAARPEVVVVTGMSGAGRTEALHILEDMGYFCIDNLPPSMIVQLAKLVGMPSANAQRLAVACDIRSRQFFDQLCEELDRLRAEEVDFQVLFLDADDDTLLKRYSSLRRRHPMARGAMTLGDAVALERQRLTSIRELANVVIDTSRMRPSRLRRIIAERFGEGSLRQGMNVSVFSFGFKYGIPLDADLVIDVRFLPNPFYDPQMRELTGFDEAVRDFVMGAQETKAFMEAWLHLLDVSMPGYVSEGKQHLSIAVGCTGGQHRSVAIAEATGAYLQKQGYRVTTSHRDVERKSAQEGDQ